MTTIIEAIFNGDVFCPIKPIKLDKNTKVKIIIESQKTQIQSSKEDSLFTKLSNILLLPELDDNDSMFTRDKDNSRDIDL
jgi:predicted DNA-binding antitoxin AbrB/MazE fold protein